MTIYTVNNRFKIDNHVFERRGDCFVNDATGLRIAVTETRRPYSAHIIGRAGRKVHMKAGNGRTITYVDLERCVRTALGWFKNG